MNALLQLQSLIRQLRSDQQGCAWTQAQTFNSLAPQTLEEAYELVSAIESGDVQELQSELSDLLYHLLFYCELAREQGWFDLADCAQVSLDKHAARMPTANERQHLDAAATNAYWQRRKAQQRQAQGGQLSGIAQALPALIKAEKYQQRAAEVGFDWQELAAVFAKVQEELSELQQALSATANPAVLQEELGDTLFSLVNLARHLQINAELALNQACAKFAKRFQHIEQQLTQKNIALLDAKPSDLETLWQEAKQYD